MNSVLRKSITVVAAVAATVALSWVACGGRLSSQPRSAEARQKVVKIKTDYPATIEQGVCGMVLFYEGDFMPGTPEADPVTGDVRRSVRPVSRRVVALELTNARDAEGSAMHQGNGFYDRVNTGFVAETMADENGFFEMELPPGRYSLFVIEDDCLYSNSRDGMGYINPITVEPDKVHRTSINITYKMAM